jgi:hypothetical protein
MLTTVLVPSAPAVTQPTNPGRRAEIDGTPQLRGSRRASPSRRVARSPSRSSAPRRTRSGRVRRHPTTDGKFDTTSCQADKLNRDVASCRVKFEKAGTYPYFCALHFAAGMVGTITVGSAAAGSTTATTLAGAAPLVTSPRAGRRGLQPTRSVVAVTKAPTIPHRENDEPRRGRTANPCVY